MRVCAVGHGVAYARRRLCCYDAVLMPELVVIDLGCSGKVRHDKWRLSKASVCDIGSVVYCSPLALLLK